MHVELVSKIKSLWACISLRNWNQVHQTDQSCTVKVLMEKNTPIY